MNKEITDFERKVLEARIAAHKTSLSNHKTVIRRLEKRIQILEEDLKDARASAEEYYEW